MKLFKLLRKKNPAGRTSRISELRSPYVKKPTFSGRIFKRGNRGERKKMLVMPTKQPKTGSRGKKILTLFITAFLAGTVIYIVGFSHFFDVKSWEVIEDGTKITDDSPMNDLLKTQKNKNLMFVDEMALIKATKNLHPEAQKIIVKKLFPTKIRIEIEKYPIVANIINIVQGVQKKFLVDSQGFLAQENIDNPELPYIKIFANEVYTVRTSPLEKAKIDYILNAINQYQQRFSMKVLNAEYYVREREVHLQTEKNFFVLIDMEKPLTPQLDKLKKVLGKLNIYTTPLEYIDLRISGTDNEKVIYKRRK